MRKTHDLVSERFGLSHGDRLSSKMAVCLTVKTTTPIIPHSFDEGTPGGRNYMQRI